MKRIEFYKKYYEITNRAYSDKIIWNKKDMEDAHRKRQLHISKTGRKVNIVFQYLTLLIMVLLCVFLQDRVVLVFFGITLYLLAVSVNDFSVIKVELLRNIVSKNTIYSKSLEKIFFLEFDEELDRLRRYTKKHVRGYVHENSNKFIAKYTAVCTNTVNTVVVVFKPKSVCLKIDRERFIFKENYSSFDELFVAISDKINELLKS